MIWFLDFGFSEAVPALRYRCLNVVVSCDFSAIFACQIIILRTAVGNFIVQVGQTPARTPARAVFRPVGICLAASAGIVIAFFSGYRGGNDGLIVRKIFITPIAKIKRCGFVFPSPAVSGRFIYRRLPTGDFVITDGLICEVRYFY